MMQIIDTNLFAVVAPRINQSTVKNSLPIIVK